MELTLKEPTKTKLTKSNQHPIASANKCISWSPIMCHFLQCSLVSFVVLSLLAIRNTRKYPVMADVPTHKSEKTIVMAKCLLVCIYDVVFILRSI